jgi:hypothetical protein
MLWIWNYFKNVLSKVKYIPFFSHLLLSIVRVHYIFRSSPYDMSHDDCAVIWHSCEQNTVEAQRKEMNNDESKDDD